MVCFGARQEIRLSKRFGSSATDGGKVWNIAIHRADPRSCLSPTRARPVRRDRSGRHRYRRSGLETARDRNDGVRRWCFAATSEPRRPRDGSQRERQGEQHGDGGRYRARCTGLTPRRGVGRGPQPGLFRGRVRGRATHRLGLAVRRFDRLSRRCFGQSTDPDRARLDDAQSRAARHGAGGDPARAGDRDAVDGMAEIQCSGRARRCRCR